MMAGSTATAGAPAASAGQPATPPYLWPNPTPATSTADTQMPLVAESAAIAGTLAAAAPAGLPANHARLRRMGRSTAPCGRVRGDPLRSRYMPTTQQYPFRYD
eukprot:9488778-Pyramimonas_sp.AAC.1